MWPGILGVEIREDDSATRDIVMTLQDAESETAGRAERALNRHLKRLSGTDCGLCNRA